MQRNLKLLASILLISGLCSGCFAVRVLRGNPEKFLPDLGLPELVIPTNSILATNAPPIQ